MCILVDCWQSSYKSEHNYAELDEVFTAPKQRGLGLAWVGDNGSTCADIVVPGNIN